MASRPLGLSCIKPPKLWKVAEVVHLPRARNQSHESEAEEGLSNGVYAWGLDPRCLSEAYLCIKTLAPRLVLLGTGGTFKWGRDPVAVPRSLGVYTSG